jgi:hypothetical protein
MCFGVTWCLLPQEPRCTASSACALLDLHSHVDNR